MVVVAPAEAKLVLAEFLDARGAVPVFPIRAFFFKINLTGLVATTSLMLSLSRCFASVIPSASFGKKRRRVFQISFALRMAANWPGLSGDVRKPR